MTPARAVELVLTFTVSLAAGLAWAMVFGLRPVLVPVVVAAALPTLLAAIVFRFTMWTLAVRLVVSLGLLVVAAAALAEASPPTPAVVVDVLGGFRNGWRQILSSAPLAEPSGGPMSTAVAVVWLGAWGAAELALRTRRILLPLLPPTAGFALALGLGAGGVALPAWVPALFTAACGAWLLLRTAARSRFGLRRWVAGAVTVAVAASVAVAAGPHLPGAEARPRFDPRVLIDDPVVVRDQVNPLATLTAQVTGDAATLFRVNTDQPVGANWRLAVLDRFEGNQWVSTATFHRVGGTISGDEPVAGSTEIRQRVTLDDLAGWFLPAITRPVEVTVSGLATDEDGVLVIPADQPRPTTFTVTSSIVAVDGTAVAAAAPAPIPDDSDPMPDPPEDIRQTAVRITRDQRSAYGKLVALRNYFRDPASGFVYDNGDDAPTGNSFNAIENLLETRQGTAEQFASAFAVMASDLGYHSRVVVGYLPGSYDEATGTYTVTTREAHAWPEVEFNGLGWVAFEPSPLERRTVADPVEDEATATTVPDPVPSNTQPDPGPPTTLPEADSGEGGAAQAFGWVVLALGAVVAAAVAAVIGIIAAKTARRRRRRQGAPAQRIAGAWREAIDRLIESGVDVPVSTTASEVAAAPGRVDAAEAPLDRLAEVANRARFAGQPPDEDDANEAWAAQDEMAGALRAGRSRLGRARLAVDPRPLVRRR